MIKSLSLLDDEIPEETPANFGNVLSNLGLGKKNQQETVGFTEESDEFAIKGIKDVVSKRLKNMRSIE